MNRLALTSSIYCGISSACLLLLGIAINTAIMIKLGFILMFSSIVFLLVYRWDK